MPVNERLVALKRKMQRSQRGDIVAHEQHTGFVVPQGGSPFDVQTHWHVAFRLCPAGQKG